ncbi:Hypothetical_protein [Hexamita inflata]|uniref:Hypothetical_protein n=1 Tax=Hexamita inflata TaxID=28002 RepID=A0AA86U784_9EUKA|nr:Hypothetical protein HINF_LOCUS31439 [Hexamita inflata]
MLIISKLFSLSIQIGPFLQERPSPPEFVLFSAQVCADEDEVLVYELVFGVPVDALLVHCGVDLFVFSERHDFCQSFVHLGQVLRLERVLVLLVQREQIPGQFEFINYLQSDLLRAEQVRDLFVLNVHAHSPSELQNGVHAQVQESVVVRFDHELSIKFELVVFSVERDEEHAPLNCFKRTSFFV